MSFVQSVLYQRFHFSDFCYEASRVSFVVQHKKQPVMMAAFPDLGELWGLSSNEAWFPGWPTYQALFPISLLSKYPSFLPQYHWHNIVWCMRLSTLVDIADVVYMSEYVVVHS